MFTNKKIKDEALALMAWGDNPTLSAIRKIDEYKSVGDEENEKNWERVLECIRRYEYPIDYAT